MKEDIIDNLCSLYSFPFPKEVKAFFNDYKESFIPHIKDDNILLCYKYTIFYLYSECKVSIKTYCNKKVKESVFKNCLKEVRENFKRPEVKEKEKEIQPVCNLYSYY